MSCLHLFNPENDIALAFGMAQYTAPPNAMRLHDAGALLPLWFCNEGDQIISHPKHEKWVNDIKSQFNIFGNIANPSSLNSISKCAPWGWSLNAKKQFLDFGIEDSILPHNDNINSIRELSHRRLTVKITQLLKEANINNPTLPLEAKNATEVLKYVHTHQSIFLKSPWSSSGRGVINASSLSEHDLIRRAEGIIRNQGSIMCEKALTKVKDFAMLFYSDGKTVKFVGLSSFLNSDKGAYIGNIIDSQHNILQSITQYISESEINHISNTLSEILSTIIVPYYNGYFGVDMMIVRSNNHFEIAPCVEVNLRMTMGVIAFLWSERHLAQGSHGVMKVEYSPNQERSSTQSTIVDHKLKSGTISLIPPDDYFNIYISVD